MYKSSSFTFIYIYIFPVFMLGGFIFGIYNSWIIGTPESLSFSKTMIVATVWVSFFLIQMPFRLKYIDTHNEYLLIKDFGKQIKLEYRDIQWITKYDITSPWFVTIKYRDNKTGGERKVSFIPSKGDYRLFRDDAMTEFIKNKIKTENPNYIEELQPSKIKNFLLLMLLSSPFVALSYYFMNGLYF